MSSTELEKWQKRVQKLAQDPGSSTHMPKPVTQTSCSPPQAQSKDEIGGPTGLEPTRYGDWERKGLCSDF